MESKISTWNFVERQDCHAVSMNHLYQFFINHKEKKWSLQYSKTLVDIILTKWLKIPPSAMGQANILCLLRVHCGGHSITLAVLRQSASPERNHKETVKGTIRQLACTLQRWQGPKRQKLRYCHRWKETKEVWLNTTHDARWKKRLLERTALGQLANLNMDCCREQSNKTPSPFV